MIIRADASLEIGTGHVMRCLALGQAWQDAGGSVKFVTACDSEGLRQRLRGEGFNVHLLEEASSDWKDIEGVLRESPGARVVLDGYHFDTDYQEKIRAAGHPLLVIDDMAHLTRYAADILLNQNLHAGELRYNVGPGTRLLLGPEYALLRREFRKWRDWTREIPAVAGHLLVTLGGADHANHTLEVIRALRNIGISELEITVLIGTGSPHVEEVKAVAEVSGLPVKLIHDAKNMPELMAQADAAVSAAGITTWELMFMGVPAILMDVAGNQEMIAATADAAGAALRVKIREKGGEVILEEKLRELIRDRAGRAGLSASGKRLVDGRGGERVAAAMAGLAVRELMP